MPRTKVKKQVANQSTKENKTAAAAFSENYEGLCNIKRKTFKEEYEQTLKDIDMKMKDIRMVYRHLLGKTLGEMAQNEQLELKSILSACTSQDDGYLSNETSTDSNLTKSRVKFTPSVNRSTFKTPATHGAFMSKQQALSMGYVTPKVKPDRPLTVLRRAQDGEMVISMQGSPILVNSMGAERANVNVPLGDGRVISVQPGNSIRQSEIPEIDDATRSELEALRDNLDRIVSKNAKRH